MVKVTSPVTVAKCTNSPVAQMSVYLKVPRMSVPPALLLFEARIWIL